MRSNKPYKKYSIIMIIMLSALQASLAVAAEKPLATRHHTKKHKTLPKTILNVAAHKPATAMLIDTGKIAHPAILKPLTINTTIQQRSLRSAVARLASIAGWHQVIWNVSRIFA